jgi:diacylglycerol kinase family enzyme
VRKILLLANPVFQSQQRRYLPRILRVFEQAGCDVEVQQTGPDRAADSAVIRAIERGIEGVIVCGGDGTVFDALQGLAGSEVPLGICPFGTGNILAQNLKIPADPVKAAQWLLQATPRPVPLGKITCCSPAGARTWFFAMAAGMGAHAAMMAAALRYGKHSAGKIAYFAAGFETLLTQPVQPFELEITTLDGTVLQRNASEMIAVRVAELNRWRPGGGLEFPFLRLASVEEASRIRLAQASLEAMLLGAGQRDRKPRQNPAARYEDVKRVQCRPIPGLKYKQPVAVQADGEILGSSCATIEMADVKVSLLANPTPNP